MATLALGAVAATVIDLRTRQVPNLLTMALAAAGIAFALAGAGRVGVASALAGGVLGLGLMLPGHLLGATGAGDVKLLAAFGTLLGPTRTATAFVEMAIAGGVIALCVAARRRRFGATVGRTARLLARGPSTAREIESPSTDNRFAYAPAVAIGAVLSALGA
jgi:prepilin peptidase CpaA